MKTSLKCAAAVFTILALAVSSVRAWEVGEHRQLGDSAYWSVMSRFGSAPGTYAEQIAEYDFLPRGVTFGQLCARFAADDMARTRFHRCGRTILEQLETLAPDLIDQSWRQILEWANNIEGIDTCCAAMSPPRLISENVVDTYLLYHLMAIRMMNHTEETIPGPGNSVSLALILEAVAQGYLADSFSAGHILTPVSDRFAGLHPRNTRETHDHYSSLGVYVINSKGDVWQTFGDRLLQWYAPTYGPAFEASSYSLMELLAVYFHSRDVELPAELQSWIKEQSDSWDSRQVIDAWLEIRRGDEYYSSRSLPTLNLMPMPVAASWSLLTQATDAHGIHRRIHYPQLHEEGLHDPDLENIDQRFLYARSAVPEWMIPPALRNAVPALPDSLIKYHPDWASVRWVQNRQARPSYKGLLLHLGGQFISAGKRYESGGLIGAGYGLWDDLLFVKSVSASVTIMPSVYEPKRLLLAPSAGFDLPFGVFSWLKGFRVEGGGIIGLRSGYGDCGSSFAVGVDSRVWPLGFTNAGITGRLKYQWLHLNRTFHGPALELILQ